MALAIGSPLKLFVTLNTEFRGCFIGQHPFILGPVGSMATQTIHGHIFISGINHLLSNGMSGMFLPIMAARTKVNGGRLIHQEDLI